MLHHKTKINTFKVHNFYQKEIRIFVFSNACYIYVTFKYSLDEPMKYKEITKKYCRIIQ